MTKNIIHHNIYNHLVGNLKKYGIYFIESKLGSQYEGSIDQISPRKENVKIVEDRVEIKLFYCIEVNSNPTETERFATIAHELGHFFVDISGQRIQNFGLTGRDVIKVAENLKRNARRGLSVNELGSKILQHST